MEALILSNPFTYTYSLFSYIDNSLRILHIYILQSYKAGLNSSKYVRIIVRGIHLIFNSIFVENSPLVGFENLEFKVELG